MSLNANTQQLFEAANEANLLIGEDALEGAKTSTATTVIFTEDPFMSLMQFINEQGDSGDENGNGDILSSVFESINEYIGSTIPLVIDHCNTERLCQECVIELLEFLDKYPLSCTIVFEPSDCDMVDGTYVINGESEYEIIDRINRFIVEMLMIACEVDPKYLTALGIDKEETTVVK